MTQAFAKKDQSNMHERPEVVTESEHLKNLIGRIEELHALKFYLGAAAEGQGSFILINGEAGIGKTHLIMAASQMAAETEFVVSEIDFKNLSKYNPFEPFINLVQSLENQLNEANKLSEQLKTFSKELDEKKIDDPESFEILNSERTIIQQLIVTGILDASKKNPIYLFLNKRTTVLKINK